MAQTTFSNVHKQQLQSIGVTDAHVQQLQAVGCDPDKCHAALSDMKARAEAAGFNWQQLLTFLLTNLPAFLSLFGVNPAPTPPGPAPVQRG